MKWKDEKVKLILKWSEKRLSSVNNVYPPAGVSGGTTGIIPVCFCFLAVTQPDTTSSTADDHRSCGRKIRFYII